MKHCPFKSKPAKIRFQKGYLTSLSLRKISIIKNSSGKVSALHECTFCISASEVGPGQYRLSKVCPTCICINKKCTAKIGIFKDRIGKHCPVQYCISQHSIFKIAPFYVCIRKINTF